MSFFIRMKTFKLKSTLLKNCCHEHFPKSAVKNYLSLFKNHCFPLAVSSLTSKSNSLVGALKLLS